jgi:HAD superfamily hydrolase (TIGR01509 family)
MIKAIIFDVDGVIFDSEEIHYATEAETMQAIGIPITVDEIREYSGVRLEEEFLDIAQKYKKDIDMPQVIKIRDEILRKKLGKGFPTVPYVADVIKILSKHYALAVASSGERRFIDNELKQADLSQYFTAFVYGEDVAHPKPSPDPFLKAAKILGCTPSQCTVIEDSPSGFQAAKAAGMLLIARKALHNKEKDFSKADYVVEDVREIPKIIEEKNLQEQ